MDLRQAAVPEITLVATLVLQQPDDLRCSAAKVVCAETGQVSPPVLRYGLHGFSEIA